MTAMSGEHIIQGIRSRNDDIFKLIQTKYTAGILAMVLELGGSSEDAEDIISESLIEIIRLVDQKDFKLTCKFGTLLYAIANKRYKQALEKQSAANASEKKAGF